MGFDMGDATFGLISVLKIDYARPPCCQPGAIITADIRSTF
jgi:hypothetical protein